MLFDPTIDSRANLSLADFTGPGLIVPELSELDPAWVVRELSQLLHREGFVPDLLAFYHAALNHEFLVNSATESGIALPHARLKGVNRSCFALGRSREPFAWGNRMSRPVQLVFLLAVPATDAAGFLQLLSAVARLGQQESLLESLRSLDSAPRLYEFLKKIKVRAD